MVGVVVAELSHWAKIPSSISPPTTPTTHLSVLSIESSFKSRYLADVALSGLRFEVLPVLVPLGRTGSISHHVADEP